MNYQQQLKQFITSQHLYTGLRITGGVLIPAVILYNLGLLGAMISLPMGALFSSLSDNPGPVHHRRNGLKAGLVLNVLMIVIGGYSRHHPWLIAGELVVFGIFLSLISVFGARASAIGLMALIAFILNIDSSLPATHVLLQAVWLVCGTAWYILFSLLFYNIRPYRPIQQAMGECLTEIAEYLRLRAEFYQAGTDELKLMGKLFTKQVEIHQHQEQLREMLFSTRKLVSESTDKGRALMMIFIDSVDLMERIMTAQQDYPQLIKVFGDSPILEEIWQNLLVLARTLEEIALSVQSDEHGSAAGADEVFKNTWASFMQLRKAKLEPSNVESFIILRHIMYSLEDITARVNRIALYSSYRATGELDEETTSNFRKFKPKQEISASLFWSNISMSSQSFRHALRVAIALLAGYLVSLFFQIGHGYWILLTIATIIKPAYGLSKQRNVQRLAGTFAGAAFAFAILYFVPNGTLLFLLMLLTMITAYSTLRMNYGVSTGFLTVFILLSFHYLHPQTVGQLLVDRVIDTVIGSVIAFLVSLFVLPSWESENIQNQVEQAIKKNRVYFDAVGAIFLARPLSMTAYKLARKEAFVALANLSDAFQKMISEPKRQRTHLQLYHQFVSSSHILTSQVAGLSAQAQRFGYRYAGEDFRPLIRSVEILFDKAINSALSSDESTGTKVNPMKKKIENLLGLRRKELSENVEETGTETRKTLSELKTVTDQFGLIAATLNEQIKIRAALK